MDSNINVVASKEQSCSAVQDVMGSENESEQTGTSDSSSSASSPMPMEDLGPVFEVKGIRAATDSSVLTFRISRLDEPDNKDSWWEVTRSSEEFEAFNRLIYDCQKYGGIIFPPLPPSIESKYEDSFLEAPIIHRKQVERYYNFSWFPCHVAETTQSTSSFDLFESRYLQLVSSHPTLGRSQALADFLSPTYVLAEKSGRKGIFAKIAESFAGSSQPVKVPYRDIEEFFQNERDWSANYSVHLKTTLNAVLTVIYSEKSNTISFYQKLVHVLTMWVFLFFIIRNHRTVEASVHSVIDERAELLPAGNEPHPSSASFQDGRFISKYPGIIIIHFPARIY